MVSVLMDAVPAGLKWSSCLVYLDDIIIVGRVFEEHLSNLRDVFEDVRQNGLTLHPKKCVFFLPEAGDIPGPHYT